MIPSDVRAAYCDGMEICALTLVTIHLSKEGISALARIIAPGILLWCRYRMPSPMTADDMQTVVRATARHLTPHGGLVRLSFQLPLMGIRAVRRKKSPSESTAFLTALVIVISLPVVE